jgi:hypothetical protein
MRLVNVMTYANGAEVLKSDAGYLGDGLQCRYILSRN